MGMFQWYMKEGKGVEKDEPQKRGFFRFMDIFFRKFWRFVRLNLIYVLLCIPTFLVVFLLSGLISGNLLGTGMQNLMAEVLGLSAPDMANPEFAQMILWFDLLIRFVISILFMALWGMGPVTAGFTYVLRNFSREEHAWVWSDFLEHTKKNFKQAIALWLIDIVVFVLVSVAIFFYASQGGYFFVLMYLMIMLLIIYTIMHFYMYPMMVTFKLSLKNLFRNALIFALGKIPSNLLVLVLLLGIHIGLLYVALMCLGSFMGIGIFVLAVLYLLILHSLSGFIVNFTVYPKLKRYMIVEDNVSVKAEGSEETETRADENE